MIRIFGAASHGVVNPTIRWATHDMDGVGHSGFLLDSGEVLDSHIVKGNGVQIRPFSYLDAYRIIVCELKADPVTVARVEIEARRLIGTPYDWRWLMGFAFPPLVRGWNDETHLGCSEYVETVCINAGFPLHDYSRVHPQHMTPRDIMLSDRLTTVYDGPPGGYR